MQHQEERELDSICKIESHVAPLVDNIDKTQNLEDSNCC